MSVRLLPAFIAGIVAVALAVLLFVPFVAREYRRRGELRVGAALVRFAAVFYGLGLMAYVLIPLPPVAPGFCAEFAHLQPQWEPLASLDGVHRPRTWSELSDLLANSSVRQFGYNVALFVPLGMLVRQLFRRSVVGAVLIGFAVSLFIELTQLTAIWSLYPCPYRLFDVDDLIANTGGALCGAVFAPVLRLLPGQRGVLEASAPRPITASRRMLGMTCDALLLWLLGLATFRFTEVVRPAGALRVWWESSALWFVPAVVLLVFTLLGRGSTLGQHAVLLRCVSRAGGHPSTGRVLVRWSAGIGGLAIAEGCVNASSVPEAGAAVAVLWCTVHAFGVTRSRDHRGISGVVAGLYVVDARVVRPTREVARRTDS